MSATERGDSDKEKKEPYHPQSPTDPPAPGSDDKPPPKP